MSQQQQQEHNNRSMPIAILLENIRSMHNVGAFFRTGDGAGIEKIFFTGYTATPPREEITKVALGAEEYIPWEQIADPLQAITTIREQGYRIVAVEQTDTSVDIGSLSYDQPICFVFGHETTGVSQEILAACDVAVEVPMFGKKESLNVSVCAGIVLFEARKKIQQMKKI